MLARLPVVAQQVASTDNGTAEDNPMASLYHCPSKCHTFFHLEPLRTNGADMKQRGVYIKATTPLGCLPAEPLGATERETPGATWLVIT